MAALSSPLRNRRKVFLLPTGAASITVQCRACMDGCIRGEGGYTDQASASSTFPSVTVTASSTGTGLQPPSLVMTLGPPGYAYTGSPTGIAVHLVPSSGLTGPVTITADDPSMTVSGGPVVFPEGDMDGVLTFTSPPNAPVGIVNVTVRAANAELPSAVMVPLRVFVGGSPGALDTSFGGTGSVTLPADPATAGDVDAMLIDPNGAITIAGDVGTVPAKSTLFARLHADGSLLLSTSVPWGASDNAALALAEDALGHCLVAGFAPLGGQSAAAIYRIVGTSPNLDPMFGTGGVVQHLVSGQAPAVARAVRLAKNGQIVIAGAANSGGSNQLGFVTTFLSDGTLPADHPLPSPAAEANGLLIDPDMVHATVVGSGSSTLPGVIVTRLDVANGTFGFAFGTNNHASFLPPGATFASGNAVGLQLNATGATTGFLAAGATGTGGAAGEAMTVVSFGLDGVLDTTFGGGAGFVMPLAAPSSALAMASAPQGEWLVAGQAGAPSSPAIVRLQSNGTTDGTKFDVSALGNGSARAVAIDPDGRIVVAGTASVAGVPHGFVARYWP